MSGPAPLIGVVGAGAMGSGIAQVAAAAGCGVVLFDAAPGAAERAVEAIGQRVDRQAAKTGSGVSRGDLDVRTADRLHGLAGVGVVIEAIVEDLALKQRLFAELEAVVADDCLLGSNTSSLSPTALGSVLTWPERFLGVHFFNPVPAMRLVEVVPGLATSPDTVIRATDLVAGWGKTVVRSTATPGFIVNRVARPFYGEAWRLYEEGAADPGTIDAVLTRSGGFRMGPFTLMDLIGHDVNEAVTRQVWTALAHDPRFAPSLAQRALVEAGWLGRKTGRGVYEHADGARPEPPPPLPAQGCPAEVFTADAGDVAHPLERVGVRVVVGDVPAGFVRLPSGTLMTRCRGETATALAAATGAPVVVVDRTGDEPTAVALAASDGSPEQGIAEAVGTLQAGGLDVYRIDDVPGLIVTRTVAMLVNLAVDALAAGVADAADIDTAMQLGTNYPRGPLAWGDTWGPSVILEILTALGDAYGDSHYRPSPRLRRAALTGRPLIQEHA